MLLGCARDAAKRKLALRFHLRPGTAMTTTACGATGAFDSTGDTREHQAVWLVGSTPAQMAWLPSLWPETCAIR